MLGWHVIQSDIYSPKCDTEDSAQAAGFHKRCRHLDHSVRHSVLPDEQNPEILLLSPDDKKVTDSLFLV